MGVTRIQHNLSAMNAMSNYQGNSGALTNNLEKLSSGYRINSAADDAAGLAISEKMRSQIAGLEKAQDNANDGISLVQTAEGALTEVNSMLTRLKTLATQSANGTYEDGVDRTNIQEETDALLSEIDRISQSTNFNGISLLDGSLDGKSQVQNVAIDETRATRGKYTTAASLESVDTKFTDFLTKEDIGKSINYTVTWQNAKGEEKTTTVSLTFQGDGNGEVNTTAGSLDKNFFTDDVGNVYKLDATNGSLATNSLNDAMEKGLKANAEFSAEFEISQVTAAGDDKGKLVFRAKNIGSAGSKVVSTGISVDFADKTYSNNTATSLKGAGTATTTSVAYDSMQRFTATSLKVVTASSDAKDISNATFEIDGKKFLLVNSEATGSFTAAQRASMDEDITLIDIDATSITATDDQYTKKIAAEISRVTGYEAKAVTSDGSDGTIKKNDDDTEAGPDLKQGDIVFSKDKLKLDGNELSLQIGDTNKDYQKVSVKIQDMSSKGLGLTGLDLSNQEAAGKAVDTIQDAINKVSTQRGQLGALQNRLDHTLNSLDATTQNITAAESQIRDVDMAKEMTQYSKNNILVQAAQSMLAQANSLPQGVLSLLQ